uniref:EGF-like domain-containing protein n=1 Tax=Periophthalmus magnuspinnatus TaxID=409849 RepID=A0A3B4AM07_9GOBI
LTHQNALFIIIVFGGLTAVSSPGDDPERGEERPHVEKRSILSCDSSFDNYCLNNGQCLFLVDLNENHCKCELGYLGTRCEHTQLVVQPMKEEEVALIIVCVVLLILGLTGALYFFCKWLQIKKSFLIHQGYSEVKITFI